MTNPRNASVLSVAGRTVRLFEREEFECSIPTRAIELLVGDRVRAEFQDGKWIVAERLPRSSVLMRTFGNQDKQIAANLDRLFVVTAVGKLFNTVAIDRLLTIAYAAGVPSSLILNKIDLGAQAEFDLYHKLDFPTFRTSAKFGSGMLELHAALADPNLRTVAFAGISGVGKSTLLNAILPHAEQRTGEVSQKTGQGRQTTSQALGFALIRTALPPLILIDLPGSQQFGVAHLEKSDVKASFGEFVEPASSCEYSDCLHLDEPHCAVKSSLETGRLAQSRYASYRHMLSEISALPDSRKYRKK